ncbi:MAG: hypothetical protein ACUZ8I_01575 [Candidatus Scalindua sp.]
MPLQNYKARFHIIKTQNHQKTMDMLFILTTNIKTYQKAKCVNVVINLGFIWFVVVKILTWWHHG